MSETEQRPVVRVRSHTFTDDSRTRCVHCGESIATARLGLDEPCPGIFGRLADIFQGASK